MKYASFKKTDAQVRALERPHCHYRSCRNQPISKKLDDGLYDLRR